MSAGKGAAQVAMAVSAGKGAAQVAVAITVDKEGKTAMAEHEDEAAMSEGVGVAHEGEAIYRA